MMRLNSVQKNRMGKKITPRNSPHYMAIEAVKEWTYKLVKSEDRDKPGRKTVMRHYNELVPYRMSVPNMEECYWIKITRQDVPITDEKTPL